MKKYLVLAAFVPGLLAAQPAANCNPSPRGLQVLAKPIGERLRPLLRDAKFAALEGELVPELPLIRRGEWTDLKLRWDIESALSTDPGLEPLLEQWVAEYPESFVARLAKGSYHSTMGYARRGGATRDKTSAEQFSAMEVEFRKAAHELRVAMELQPDSALPHAFLMTVARAVSGPDTLRGLLAEAERVDPHNLAARNSAVWAMVPKWGGDFEEQDQLLQRAATAGLPPAQVRFLAYQAEMARADHYAVIAHDKKEELAHYRAAAELCPDSAWRAIAVTASVLEDWKTASDAADRYLALEPNDAQILRTRGWALEKQGKLEVAAKDYEAASDLGETWAQYKFGYLLMLGQVVPLDRSRARRLLQAAVAKGSAEAVPSLEWLNRTEKIR